MPNSRTLTITLPAEKFPQYWAFEDGSMVYPAGYRNPGYYLASILGDEHVQYGEGLALFRTPENAAFALAALRHGPAADGFAEWLGRLVALAAADETAEFYEMGWDWSTWRAEFLTGLTPEEAFLTIEYLDSLEDGGVYEDAELGGADDGEGGGE